MPEFRECLAHFLLLFWFFHHRYSVANWTLLGLWADLTQAEVGRTGKGKDGIVQQLNPTSTFKRGGTNRQTPLYPPTLRDSGDLALQNLVLGEIGHTPRAIILDFKSLRLKLSYLTHTSVQVLRRDQWNMSFMAVNKKHRGKVALALEFADYFIVFISNDLVFQPEWESAEDTAAISSPPVYDDYRSFLNGVADWIEDRRTSLGKDRQGLACEVVRGAQDVWCGVGVYTVCELFFDAGISPFLTEAEVFECPSRTARLCEAFYSYAYHSKENLMPLLKAAMVDDILAPSIPQRLKYIHWLHVYAKDTTSIPVRMSILIDAYDLALDVLEAPKVLWSRDSCLHLFDVFEPLYIQDAFMTKGLNLGHLIFGGNVWKLLGGPISSEIDPLSTIKEVNFRSPHLYYGQKQIWSIVRCFSENSVPFLHVKRPKKKALIEYTNIQRTKCLFATIVNSSGNSVAIGPLEYCGNGIILRDPSGKKQLSITHSADPRLSKVQIIKMAKKPPLSDQPPSIVKKRRISQDKQLVLSTQWRIYEMSPASADSTSHSNTLLECVLMPERPFVLADAVRYVGAVPLQDREASNLPRFLTDPHVDFRPKAAHSSSPMMRDTPAGAVPLRDWVNELRCWINSGNEAVLAFIQSVISCFAVLIVLTFQAVSRACMLESAPRPSAPVGLSVTARDPAARRRTAARVSSRLYCPAPFLSSSTPSRVQPLPSKPRRESSVSQRCRLIADYALVFMYQHPSEVGGVAKLTQSAYLLMLLSLVTRTMVSAAIAVVAVVVQKMILSWRHWATDGLLLIHIQVVGIVDPVVVRLDLLLFDTSGISSRITHSSGVVGSQ
ncbi:hypothetical protein BJ912DRAFT_929655 [Pholiota molesta]|nr:hypothetical protein BJ912DRAFT_929655 [Pholiota molesta]